MNFENAIDELSNLSGGANELDSYTGFNDPALDFGKAGGSFFNMNVGQPFKLRFRNTHATFNFYVWISCGLDYRPGTIAGQIDPDGTFAGESAGDGADPGTSITVSCPLSTQSLYKYARWMQNKPTILSKIEVTADDPSTLLASDMVIIREDAIRQDPAINIPMRKYASKDAFNLQFIDVFEEVVVSDQHIVKILVPANGYTNVNLYFGASLTQPKLLENKVAAALKTGATNETIKRAITNAGKLRELQQKTAIR